MRLASFTLTLLVLATISTASKLPSKEELSEKSKSGEIVDLDAIPNETTEKPKSKKVDTYLVPLSQWHCGSNEWDKWLAHELIKSDCPAKMIEANDCCLAHDICYSEQLPQEQCDSSFCQCLDNALVKEGCGSIAKSYCGIVQIFGESAHKNSKISGKNETVPSTTTVVPSTAKTLPPTTTPVSTTQTPLIKKLDEAEKFLFQRNVNKSLDHSCFEESKEGKCRDDLMSCEDEGFTCIYKFCECSHNTLFSGPNLKRVECRKNLKEVCGNYFVNEVDYPEANTAVWIEEKLGLSVVQAIIIFICFLVSSVSALFWLVHYVCRRRKIALSKGFINDANSSNSSSASFFNFISDDKGTTAPLNCMPLLA